MNYRNDIVQNIKDCGQSLIDNAENFANYDYINNSQIVCHVDCSDESPYISIHTDIIPENFLERWK